MALKKAKSGRTMSPAQPADATEPHGAELDRYDIAILRELQLDARLSNTELASRIGISAAPTWRRVKWLEEQGYITGYRTEIDRRKIGLGVLAFVRIDADRNTASATRQLEDAIRRIPEVISCHYISGSGTFELQVLTTDLDAFSKLSLDTLLNANFAGRVVRKLFPVMPAFAQRTCNRLRGTHYVTEQELRELYAHAGFARFEITRYEHVSGWRGVHHDCLAEKA